MTAHTYDASVVVVADDDDDLRMLVTIKLRQAGFDVTPVSNGTDALEAIRELRADLAVLDVMMPGLSGLDVIAEVRADASLSACRLLLLSVRHLEDDLDRGYARGADDYLAKPFSPRELVMRAQALVHRTT
ncbi:MAG TPA: response regulator [Candidatus Lumbricidophila sp.]|nr:response regulator [Candidatus Lumbricidophila sp.]